MVAGSVLRHRSRSSHPCLGGEGAVDHLEGQRFWVGVIYVLALLLGVGGGACVLALT